MEYRIEYDLRHGRRCVSFGKTRMLAFGLTVLALVVFAVFVWHDRQNVMAVCAALEEMAMQIRDGASATDAIGAFCEQLQGRGVG